MAVIPWKLFVVSILLWWLALSASPIFAFVGPACRIRQRIDIAASAITDSELPSNGLHLSVGDKGLDTLSFNGQSLLVSPQNGALRLARPVVGAPSDPIQTTSSSPDQESEEMASVYSWGRVDCSYQRRGARLEMKIKITNTSGTPLSELTLRLMELTFPSIPKGNTLEPGMFGYDFKGGMRSLSEGPLSADPYTVAPILHIDYGNGALDFSSDDCIASIKVARPTNPPSQTSYPFLVSVSSIDPNSTRTCRVSLRFGSAAASMRELSGDVLKRYAEKYPFRLKWKDRRPIGAIYLAKSGAKVPTNPRRWVMTDAKIDISTNEGKAAFRKGLLGLADRSIKILKETKAQGMITWDPEGQEYLGAAYYGDPRLTPTMAPETDFKGDGAMSAIDEYFAKFRRAGLKVGVCIRPQQITIVNGKPRQGIADDQHAAQVLIDKIAYAKKRWRCTLFYIDSTHGTKDSLDPNIFQTVAATYPDVLLMPENESMRYFAYSAPLNSYVHHKISSTPSGVRMVYPRAFSVLLAASGDEPEDHDALVEAIQSGDILIFNCWYNHPGVDKIKKIYNDAAQ